MADIRKAVSIPSRRVGDTATPTPRHDADKSLHPLKAGRRLVVLVPIGPFIPSFHPLKAGRKLAVGLNRKIGAGTVSIPSRRVGDSAWAKEFKVANSGLHPLKAGRRPARTM